MFKLQFSSDVIVDSDFGRYSHDLAFLFYLYLIFFKALFKVTTVNKPIVTHILF